MSPQTFFIRGYKMIKVNLGCGWRNFGSDWHHVDGGDYEHLDLHDIFNLPFKDNTVDIIYASHVIEYFDRNDVEDIIGQWRKKLKPGGIFRVAVPDFEAMVGLYYHSGYSIETFLGPLYGKMPMGDETIYHKTAYDFSSLKKVLLNVGFSKVERYDLKDYDVHVNNDDHSQAYIPKMNKESGTLISLNVNAEK